MRPYIQYSSFDLTTAFSMKLVIILSVIIGSYAAKLDRTYLPPASAATAGGSDGSLNAPLETPLGPSRVLGSITNAGPSRTQSQFGLPAEGGDYQQPFDKSSRPVGNFGQPSDSSVFGQLSGSPVFRQSTNPSRNIQFGQSSSNLAPYSPVSMASGPQTIPASDSFGQEPSTIAKDSFGPQDFQQPQQPERPQAEGDRNAEIIKYDNQNDGETFSYSFETSNGISAEESGVATNGVMAQGGYSYTGDDGQFYKVTYTADENGYQPRGDHLPTPPPIPDAILRSIEKNAQAAASGTQEGAYRPDENEVLTSSQQYKENNLGYQEPSQGYKGSSLIKNQGSSFTKQQFNQPQGDRLSEYQYNRPQGSEDKFITPSAGFPSTGSNKAITQSIDSTNFKSVIPSNQKEYSFDQATSGNQQFNMPQGLRQSSLLPSYNSPRIQEGRQTFDAPSTSSVPSGQNPSLNQGTITPSNFRTINPQQLGVSSVNPGQVIKSGNENFNNPQSQNQLGYQYNTPQYQVSDNKYSVTGTGISRPEPKAAIGQGAITPGRVGSPTSSQQFGGYSANEGKGKVNGNQQSLKSQGLSQSGYPYNPPQSQDSQSQIFSPVNTGSSPSGSSEMFKRPTVETSNIGFDFPQQENFIDQGRQTEIKESDGYKYDRPTSQFANGTPQIFGQNPQSPISGTQKPNFLAPKSSIPISEQTPFGSAPRQPIKSSLTSFAPSRGGNNADVQQYNPKPEYSGPSSYSRPTSGGPSAQTLNTTPQGSFQTSNQEQFRTSAPSQIGQQTGNSPQKYTPGVQTSSLLVPVMPTGVAASNGFSQQTAKTPMQGYQYNQPVQSGAETLTGSNPSSSFPLSSPQNTKEEFGGPRQKPSFSTDEGYKY